MKTGGRVCHHWTLRRTEYSFEVREATSLCFCWIRELKKNQENAFGMVTSSWLLLRSSSGCSNQWKKEEKVAFDYSDQKVECPPQDRGRCWLDLPVGSFIPKAVNPLRLRPCWTLITSGLIVGARALLQCTAPGWGWLKNSSSCDHHCQPDLWPASDFQEGFGRLNENQPKVYI